MSLIEEIDSPTLRDKHPKVQGATWTSVRDLALVPWSPAAHALLPVRTGPPFETFRNGFVAAWTARKNNFGLAHLIIAVILVNFAHPIIAVLTFVVLVFAHPTFAVVLSFVLLALAHPTIAVALATIAVALAFIFLVFIVLPFVILASIVLAFVALPFIALVFVPLAFAALASIVVL